MSKIEIDAKALRLLYGHARRSGTVEHWAAIALEWVAHAEAEIVRMKSPPLPDVIERACDWLRSLQFGQPDAYNCADLLEQMAREAAKQWCDCGRELSPGKCNVCDNDD